MQTWIAISDPGLARVLEVYLRDAKVGRLAVAKSPAEAGRGDLVVVTPSDCDAITAAELDRRGVKVVVLAPVPRSDEMVRYRAAGADYIVMSVENSRELVEVIRARSSQSSVTDFLAAASHPLSPKFSS